MTKINRYELCRQVGCDLNTNGRCDIHGVRFGDAACILNKKNEGPLAVNREESEKQMGKLIEMKTRYETFTNSGNNPSEGNARSR